MERDYLTLKRASASRPFGEWDDDVDVLADDAVVRRIFKANAVREESPWMWTLLFRTAPGDGLAFTNREAPVSPGEIGAALSSCNRRSRSV